MAFCKNCGAQLSEGQKFCVSCGQPQEGATTQTTQPAVVLVPQIPSVMDVLRLALGALSGKPLRLWGLSLMYQLLTLLAVIFGVLPIISIPIVLVLSVGMTAIFLDGYRGKEVNSDQLFMGFKSFWRMAGGMGWRFLWTLIWSIIPIVGIVTGVVKSYAYRFVPYILLTNPDISATEALRLSMRKTKGYCGKMFLADLLIALVIIVGTLVLLLLSRIPYLGMVFVVLTGIWELLMLVFVPLLLGVVNAAFYEEIEKVSQD